MSLSTKLMETIVQVIPDRKPDRLIQQQPVYVGQPISRVDGPLKVTGGARFSAEYELPGLAYAALAYSTIARGRITRLDTAAAMAASGVLGIITHQNAPELPGPLVMNDGGAAASPLPILQGPQVYWNGQPIAIAIAETQEAAEHAAALITAEYTPEPARTSLAKERGQAKLPTDSTILMQPSIVTIGDAEAALAGAAYRVDNTYTTPRYNHNAIEPHASIATFEEDGRLVVFDATQNAPGVKASLAKTFSLKPEQIQIIYPFVGGGFGGKGFLWMNTMLCVLAARQLGRPVKLALSRAGVFRLVGGRTSSEQRVAIGADASGKFM